MDLEITGKRLLLGFVMVASGIAIDVLVFRLSSAETQSNSWLLLLGWHLGGAVTGAGLAMPFGNKWVLLIGAVVGLLLAGTLLAILAFLVWYFIAPGLGGG